MLIKLYIHPNKLINHEAVLAKQMPNSQYEIEIFVSSKDYKISFQENGVLLIKRKFLEKIFRRG